MEASEDALNHYSRDSLLTENTQSLEYRRYRTSTWLVRAETHVSFLWALRVFHAGRPFFSCAYPLTLWGSGRNGFILPSRKTGLRFFSSCDTTARGWSRPCGAATFDRRPSWIEAPRCLRKSRLPNRRRRTRRARLFLSPSGGRRVDSGCPLGTASTNRSRPFRHPSAGRPV